jgi:protein-disulfide isomerase
MKRNLLAVTVALAGCLFGQQPAARPKPPARSALPSASGITREQGDAILNELKQIRSLLEKLQPGTAPPPEPTPVRGTFTLSADDRVLGNRNAPITMVEFTDYQCPFCKDFHKNTFPILKRDFIDTGKVRFVTRDVPLDFHQHAQISAEGARCAGEQGKFWQMRDVIFQNSPRLAAEDLVRYAGEVGLNQMLFQNCLNTHKFEVDVRLNLAHAATLKITGTPSFLLGPSTGDTVEGEIIEGALPVTSFVEKLTALEPKTGQLP